MQRPEYLVWSQPYCTRRSEVSRLSGLSGRYPRGPFEFLVGVLSWNARVNAYVGLLVDRYPPFSLR